MRILVDFGPTVHIRLPAFLEGKLIHHFTSVFSDHHLLSVKNIINLLHPCVYPPHVGLYFWVKNQNKSYIELDLQAIQAVKIKFEID